MNISFAKTEESMIDLRKFVTRRLWQPKTANCFKEGSIHSSWTKTPFVKGARRIGKIKALKDAYLENLDNITNDDLHSEGGIWETKHDFYLEFDPKLPAGEKPNREVYVAEFVPVSLYNEELKAEVPIWQTAAYIRAFLELNQLNDTFSFTTNEEERCLSYLRKRLENTKEIKPSTLLINYFRTTENGQLNDGTFYFNFIKQFQLKFYGVSDWLLFAAQNKGKLPKLLPKYQLLEKCYGF